MFVGLVVLILKNTQYNLKLLDEELILSQDTISKIKKLDTKAKYFFYVGVTIGGLVILAALIYKIVRIFR